MSILRGFLPFILFAALVSSVGTDLALTIAAAVAVVTLLRDRWRNPASSLKILEISSVLLFVALVVVKRLLAPSLSLFAINMCVNGGLALVAIGSMLVGQPFTLQYAREQVPSEFWHSPVFLATNYRITGVWAAAFVIQAVASALAVIIRGVSSALPMALIIAAYAGAVLFTIEYPKRVRARAAAVHPRLHAAPPSTQKEAQNG